MADGCTHLTEGHDLKGRLGFGAAVDHLGEIAYVSKCSGNLVTELRREAEFGKDWTVVGQTASD